MRLHFFNSAIIANSKMRAKNHALMFVLVYNRSRASSTQTRPTSTNIGWRVKENFPETFKSQLEKNKNVIYRAGSVRVGKNCALGLSTAEAVGLGQYSDRGHSFSQYGPTQAGE